MSLDLFTLKQPIESNNLSNQPSFQINYNMHLLSCFLVYCVLWGAIGTGRTSKLTQHFYCKTNCVARRTDVNMYSTVPYSNDVTIATMLINNHIF